MYADDRPTAAVSLGDSFISGEAGRWQGNAAAYDPFFYAGDRWGTDLAAWGCTSVGNLCRHSPELESVYGTSYVNGCNRSARSAEIASADLAVDRRFNLACSGAVTDNVYRSSNGGKSFKGEAPQADQLAQVARENKVKYVVLSIGGNDIEFSDIIKACVLEYLKPIQGDVTSPQGERQQGKPVASDTRCETSQDPKLVTKVREAEPKVAKAVDEVRAVMREDGYADDDYRFVLQSYPSVISRGDDNRYGETYDRFFSGGCPMFNSDLDWADGRVVPMISEMLQRVATDRKTQFVDMSRLFRFHSLCSKADTQADGSHNQNKPLPSDTAEWARFLVALGSQGDQQESIHPNAYGQRALGRCLTQVVKDEFPPLSHLSCHDQPRLDYDHILIRRIEPQPER
ncbi:GDSL-type esterase/lipase family protein [Streptomyces yunnanensis]|uniref:GDSL-type esterase/lipase family protein n=1 Tax=Streptomyces yunnanensis TaxID=156453 RepID=UPI00093754B2|nr:GDSL-type esterase/lipase family protein [Streptomyces yunnanensis]